MSTEVKEFLNNINEQIKDDNHGTPTKRIP